MEFTVSADQQSENQKREKYWDLARELKRPWNVRVTAIPIVIGTFGTVPNDLERKLEDLEIGELAETI